MPLAKICPNLEVKCSFSWSIRRPQSTWPRRCARLPPRRSAFSRPCTSWASPFSCCSEQFRSATCFWPRPTRLRLRPTLSSLRVRSLFRTGRENIEPNDTACYVLLFIVLLLYVPPSHYPECGFVKSRSVKCCSGECHYAEWRGDFVNLKRITYDLLTGTLLKQI